MAMQPTGIDDTLSLEAVYFPYPIPSGQAALVVMGAVFDKVYFPGVYLPKGGYDVAELDKEIARLEALPVARDHDTSLLIGTLKLTKYAKTLDGFCEFTGDSEHIFGRENDIPKGMVKALYDELYGPPPPGFIPTFSTGHSKGIPGSDEAVSYPGGIHYFARALLHSGRTGAPLLNDIPSLPIPGVPNTVPIDNAKRLAAILAIECTKIALPPTPLFHIEDLMEFRDANKDLLRAFRRSMLRYAADLNGKIKDLTVEDFEAKTGFFIETQIVPAMDELNATMNDPARPWHRRALDAIKILPEVGGAFMTGGPAAALAKALTASASQFFVEVAAKGDKEEALKRSGLTYLMRLKAFHDTRT